ncbi:TadE family protein [Xylanimonas protaetiae]|uniref:Pilus assembly protein n=1 Tax=Xylanimonas protaetiae TaxID=2509457 RepID=A0A4P6F0Z7_9MICO|nr:TadE family protein [Xylanimonas protaetiae]QAY68765.1 pilus assembly protein [Xylanimonas protaetiae]
MPPRHGSSSRRRPRRRAAARVRRPEWGSDRGSATIELAIVLPAFMVLMLLGVQAALYFHARTVAITAATEGAKAAAVLDGRTADGEAAALAFVAEAGGDDVLPDVATTAEMTTDAVTLVVTGRSLSLVPGWDPEVRQHATTPRERPTP